MLSNTKVDLGAENYNQYFQTNGKEAAGIFIYLLPGAYALSTTALIRQTMDQLGKSFHMSGAYVNQHLSFLGYGKAVGGQAKVRTGLGISDCPGS